MRVPLLERVRAERDCHGGGRQLLVEAVASLEPIGRHRALALDFELSAALNVVATEHVKNSHRRLAHVDAQGETARFHAACRVDRISEQTVARHFQTNDTRDDGTRVNARPQLQLAVGQVAYAEVDRAAEEVQRHRRNLARVPISVADGESGRDHVRVADRLNLVDVVAVDDVVEASVEVVEEVDDLQGRALRGNVRETDDVTEEDRDEVEALGVHRLAVLQLFGNGLREHAVQQLLGLALLLVELLRALLDERLEVRRVRLKHLEHRVHDRHVLVRIDATQVTRKRGERRAVRGVLRPRALEYLVQSLGRLLVECGAESFLQHAPDDIRGFHGQLGVGPLACDNFLEYHAEAINVALLRASAVLQRIAEVLGGRVQLSQTGAQLVLLLTRLVVRVAQGGKSKVGNLEDPACVDQAVGRLQAAVEPHGAVVEVRHSLRGVRCERKAERPIELELAGVLQHVLETALGAVCGDNVEVAGINTKANEAVEVVVLALPDSANLHEQLAIDIDRFEIELLERHRFPLVLPNEDEDLSQSVVGFLRMLRRHRTKHGRLRRLPCSLGDLSVRNFPRHVAKGRLAT
eukprot:Opistho-1_new@49258